MNIFACIFNVLFAAEPLSGGSQIIEVKKGTKLACVCKLSYADKSSATVLNFSIPFTSKKEELSLHVKQHHFILGGGIEIYWEGSDNKKREYKTKKSIVVSSLASGSFTVNAEIAIMNYCKGDTAAASNLLNQLFEFDFKGEKIFSVDLATYKIDRNHLSGVKFIEICTSKTTWFYSKILTPMPKVKECCLSTQGQFLFVNDVEMLKSLESSTGRGKYKAMLSYEQECEITVMSENAMLFVKDVGKNVEPTGKVETATK